MTETASVEENASEELELSPAEQKAHDGGWRPEDEWEGDPDAWVDFKEFNFRGELMDRISSQTRKLTSQDKELAELKDGFVQWKDHATKVAKLELDKQLADLKQIKKDALAEGDHDTVVEADDRIADVKAEQKEQSKEPEPPPQNVVDADVKEWVDSNDWYRDDIIMHGAADALTGQIHQENPDWTPKQVLAEVTQKIKGKFPDAFPGTRQRTNQTSEPSAGGKRTARKSKFSVNLLNEEQRKIGQTFVASGALESLAVYAQELGEMGELS